MNCTGSNAQQYCKKKVKEKKAERFRSVYYDRHQKKRKTLLSNRSGKSAVTPQLISREISPD